MFSFIGRLIFFCLMISMIPFSAHAQAVQMLPPLDFSGNVCAGANAGIMYWDGASAVHCIPGITGNGSGDVGIGSSAPAAMLDVFTNAAIPGININNGQNSAALSINNHGSAGTAISITDVDYDSSIVINKTVSSGLANGAMAGLTINGSYSQFGDNGLGYGIQSVVTNNESAATGYTLYGGNFSATANALGNTAVGLNVSAASSGGTAYAALFNGGNVGIGTTVPAYNLDVTGTTNSTAYTFGVHNNVPNTQEQVFYGTYTDGVGGSDFVMGYNTTSGGGNQYSFVGTRWGDLALGAGWQVTSGGFQHVPIVMYLTVTSEGWNSAATGQVGIDTTTPQAILDVAGEVRVGTTGAACSANNAGSISWANGNLQLCDGTRWRKVLLSP